MRRHPAVVAVEDGRSRSERAADATVAAMGSPRFIVAQTVVVALWVAGNLWLLSRPFDPYPFILLNLAFSTQAAYAAPLILLASRRADAKRDAQAAHDHHMLRAIAEKVGVEVEP